MSNRHHRISVLAVLAVASLGMFSAALAWACTPQSHIDLGATSGHPGDSIAVSGNAFLSGPVEIHWNSSTGPLLATATGPAFTVNVTLPKVAAGVYYLHGVARDSTGNIAGDAARALQVRVPAAPSTGKTRVPGASAPRPRPTTGGAPAPKAPAAKPAPAARVRAPEPTPAVPAPAAPVQPSANPVVRTDSGQRVFGGSAAPSKITARPARAHTAARAIPGNVLRQTAQAQLGSGTGLWKAPGAKTARASLRYAGGRLVPTAGSSSRFAVGLGLLGVSLVVMLAGFLVAAIRRGRVLAGSRGEHHSDH